MTSTMDDGDDNMMDTSLQPHSSDAVSPALNTEHSQLTQDTTDMTSTMDDGDDNMMDASLQPHSSDAVSPALNTEHSQLTHRRPERSASREVEKEFVCSVCLQLSVLPTTLTCGHTTCRHCLAQWYFTSNKKECPLCKSFYEGHPKINTQLRNMLTRLYPDEMEEREQETMEASNSVIAKYDIAMSGGEKQSTRSEITSFCSGIIVACCIFVVTYLAWYWKSHDDNLLVMKPVVIWTPSDVETWMNEISWAGQYAHHVQEKFIDGRLLLSVDESDLMRLLNISETSHAKAFMLLIDDLQESGVKMPVNLWEYKALYPGRCLFLVFGLKDFPRTTILYLWVYFREEMFYPFVMATQEDEEFESLIHPFNSTEDAYNFEPSRGALMGFLSYTILMPEYLIGLFAYKMFRHHIFTPIFVLATVICRLILEVLKIKDMIENRSWGLVADMCKDHGKHLLSALMFMVLWPIIPSLICDVFFYCALYVSPIQMLSTVNTKLRQQQL